MSHDRTAAKPTLRDLFDAFNFVHFERREARVWQRTKNVLALISSRMSSGRRASSASRHLRNEQERIVPTPFFPVRQTVPATCPPAVCASSASSSNESCTSQAVRFLSSTPMRKTRSVRRLAVSMSALNYFCAGTNWPPFNSRGAQDNTKARVGKFVVQPVPPP